MAQVFAVQNVPVEAWLLSGTENARYLSLASPATIKYNTGSPDTLPAFTAATVAGGGAMDLTAATYMAYTVQGSAVVTVDKEANMGGVAGTYALLALVRPEGVYPIQQAGGAGGGSAFQWATKTANYTITGADSGILVDASSGSVTITLPTAIGVAKLFAVKRVDTTYANTVTIATTSSQTIDGAASASLVRKGHGYAFGSDGANWDIPFGFFPNPLTAHGQEAVGDANAIPVSSASGGPITAAAGGNAGTTPPAPVASGTTDARGVITFGTGTGPTAGAMVVGTFASAFGAAPTIVLTALNSATQALSLYISAYSTTGFTVSCATAPAAGQANTVYACSYVALG